MMSETASGPQRVRDPLHGLILFGESGDAHRDETDRIAWRLINTAEFQRLRRIRQLGFSDLVFPGATHSRFAHSVGVYHTARQLAKIIRRQTGKNQERERIVLLAALLHDIGHGPFSHAFEAATRSTGLHRQHEDWSIEIISSDTEVNRVLRDVDESLPEEIGNLLKDEEPKDIYATIVSSQFDADRLDYIQRDRLAAGVEFGRVDREWLLDCLEVGSITVGEASPHEAPCLYLGPKGLFVAEEYLEARFRLYRMVYMHKTTRAAEKMLECLLSAVATHSGPPKTKEQGSLVGFVTSENPSLGLYLDLDDSAVWSALTVMAEGRLGQRISEMATRLRNRRLYKCVDIGVHDKPNGNLYRRFLRKLEDRPHDWRDGLLYDTPSITAYKWYDFDDTSALNKILVKPRPDMEEPVDIIGESHIAKTLHGSERIQRVYAPDRVKAEQLQQLLEETDK